MILQRLTQRFTHGQRLFNTSSRQFATSSIPRSVFQPSSTRFLASTAAALTLTTLTAYHTLYLTPTADACGIVAFVSTNEPALDHLLEGLHILQNRGYDSAGIATVQKVDKLEPDSPAHPEAASPTKGHIHGLNTLSLQSKVAPEVKENGDATASHSKRPAPISTSKHVIVTSKFASKGNEILLLCLLVK